MDIDRYLNIRKNPDSKIFTFTSDGRHGQLTKVVIFEKIEKIPQTYNLALGTIRGRKIDFEETTDNGDRNKVLATVFYIAQAFSAVYPGQNIFVSGRDKLTARLYRAVINHSYNQLIAEFEIYGGVYQKQGDKYNFEHLVSDKTYDAFLFEQRR